MNKADEDWKKVRSCVYNDEGTDHFFRIFEVMRKLHEKSFDPYQDVVMYHLVGALLQSGFEKLVARQNFEFLVEGQETVLKDIEEEIELAETRKVLASVVNSTVDAIKAM